MQERGKNAGQIGLDSLTGRVRQVPPQKILVVDDDVDFAETIADILAAHHFDVRSVNNPKDAVEQELEHMFPVALVDIRLGRDNGIELIHRLKEVNPGILCVMMTAYAAVETTIMALQQGAYDYIRKPIGAKELLSALERCFERIRLEEEAAASRGELEHRNRGQRQLLESARAFAACASIDEFHRQFLDQFIAVTQAEAGIVYSVEAGTCRLKYRRGLSAFPETVASPFSPDDLAFNMVQGESSQLLLQTPAEGTVLGVSAASIEQGSLLFGAIVDIPPGSRCLAVSYKHALFSPLDSEFAAMLLPLSNETLRALHASEELRESERRYRMLMDHLPVGVYRLSGGIAGNFLVANAALAHMCGFENVEELLATPLEEIIPDPDQREHLLRIVQTTGTDAGNELWLQRKDGDQIQVSAVPHAVASESGNVLYVDGVIQDITARKKAEEQLRLDELRLEALISLGQMSDASLRELTDFTLEEAVRLTNSKIGYLAFMDEDETILTMHSWSRSAMKECAIQEKPLVYPVETTGLWGEAVRQRKPIITNDYAAPSPLKRGYPEGHVQVARHMNVPIFDGDRIVILAGVGNKEGEYDSSDVRQLTLLMQGMWQIIRRHQSETALRRLGAAVEQGGEAVLVADVTGRVEYANPAFERITGVPANEIVGGDARTLADNPEEESYYQHIWDIVTAGTTWTGQISTNRRDGSPCELEAVISPIRGSEGRVISLVAILRDVTERTRLEAQLRQSQKMEAIGQLAGGVAHDFNNLLQAIQGYTEMAISDLPEKSSVSNYMSEVLKASKRAATLVRQLLTFSRRQVFQPRPVDLNIVIAETMKMLRRLIGEHIELDLCPGYGLGSIHADTGQIEQILMNLCVNARDALSGGGRIIISTRNIRLDRAFCEKHPFSVEGDYVVLEVADTGSGMTPDVLEHIFEPFFTTKGVGQGTGLGLATVYGIVKQHEGIVEVDSAPGAGTTFRIYLPSSANRSETAPSAPGNERTTSGGSETILLAEDDDIVRKMAVEVLRRAGYKVLIAQDGEEAVKVFEENASAVDLVLLDVVMPRMSGPAACNQICQIRPDVRVIYSSGYSAEFVGGNAPELGEIPLIQKPYRSADLLQKVREVLSARR